MSYRWLSTHGGHWAAGGADIGEDVAIGVLQSIPKCNAQLCDSQEHDQPIEIGLVHPMSPSVACC